MPDVNIRRLKTEVPGLDSVLGGGLPEFSFNLIAGTLGSGKTTLAHQVMFALANQDNRALFFTVLGEPALKMLRYQQQFSFFDINKIDDSIRFVNLSEELLSKDFDHVLSRIAEQVREYTPRLVFIDSFRPVMQLAILEQGVSVLHQFLHQLVIQMTSWQATTFLIGEYPLSESESSPLCTVADGVLWLSQSLHRDSMVRKLQIIKMRGQAHSPGLHTFRICNEGITVFPRAIIKQSKLIESAIKISTSKKRIAMGIPDLDEMLGGGLPAGYSLLVTGPSGSGKTILASKFLSEGIHRGEPGVIAAFEKSPGRLLSSKLNVLVREGKVGVIDTSVMDLSIDEIIYNLIGIIKRMQAKRLVIDSLSGFELALAPEFRDDFRGAIYRLTGELTGMGVTILMTTELEDRYTDLRFSPFNSSFITDALIVQRYIQIAGQFKRVLSVVKIRGSQHSKDIRLFEINNEDIVIGEALSGYDGIMSDRPRRRSGKND
ncbi:MAG: ATPase domain-containing protein [Methylococcales bacterium]|nr:ATPase domain-containing protein [Methylococcales bacterium]